MSKITFLGAAQTVTGSRTLIDHYGKKILIDCGLFQGPKEIRDNNWTPIEQAKDLDAVILTHAHIDHSGYLPKIFKDGYKGKVYSTQGTFDLCKIMLPDSGRLHEEDAEFANRTKYSHHDPALPLYTEADANACLRFFSPCQSRKWIQIDPHISIKFEEAGHILGASILQVALHNDDGIKLVTFSGDIGNSRSVIMLDPTPIKETDYLVLESTYGDRMQSRDNPMDQLAEVITRVVGRGGTLIIPSFAVGRAQEVMFLIKQLEKSGRIPNYPVFLDSPMAKEATEVYQKHLAELKVSGDFEPKNLFYTKTRDESMMLTMNSDPKIIISAAGMLSGGRVLHHLKAKLGNAACGVLFVGYQVQGTKGHLLKNGLKKIRIHHQEIDVEAEVFSIDSLSAHADSEDLIAWARHFEKPPHKVFLNHGEKNALETLKYRLKSELQWEDILIPAAKDSINL